MTADSAVDTNTSQEPAFALGTPCRHAEDGCSSRSVGAVALAGGSERFPGAGVQHLCVRHLLLLEAVGEARVVGGVAAAGPEAWKVRR